MWCEAEQLAEIVVDMMTGRCTWTGSVDVFGDWEFWSTYVV